MKNLSGKLLLLPVLVLVASGFVSSCSRVDETVNPVHSESRQYFASLTDMETKTSLSSFDCICWSAGDKVSVFSSSTNECYLFQGNDGSQCGTLIKDPSDKSSPAVSLSKNYALYPYSDGNQYISEGVFQSTIPSVQSYGESSFGVGANPMLAVTSNSSDDRFYFKSYCAVLDVRMYSPTDAMISEITFSGNSDEIITGSIVLNAPSTDKELPSFAFAPSAEGKQITLSCGAEGVEIGNTAECPTDFYIVVPPILFSKGFTVSITDTDGNEYAKSTSKAVTLRANAIQPMAAFLFDPVITTINGTSILKTSNVFGLISDSSTGTGIPGVPVTDGYKYVLTDGNGVYQMTGNEKCRMVYYSLPSGYEVPLDDDKCPCFYSISAIDLTKANRNDFKLKSVGTVSDNFTLIAIGDPQVTSAGNVNRYSNEFLSDMKSTLDIGQSEGKYSNAVAMTLGDIVGNVPSLWPNIRETMSDFLLASGEYVPFYQTIGNHDHNYGDDRYESQQAFMDVFGPVDYSFNIGKAHIISMDNVFCTSRSGIGWSYRAGISAEQLEWLKADLDCVTDKQDKLVVFCCHIPFGEKVKTGRVETNSGLYVQNAYNYDEVLSLLTEFHDARVMSGHRHTWRNVVNDSYVCKSGRPLVEYNPGAACGGWWSSHSNCDGVPIGYQILSIRGNEVYDWEMKSVYHDASEQMRVYDGNQVYAVSDRNYSWSEESNAFGTTGYTAPGYTDLANSFVVSLWNGDDTYWKLELYQNDVKVGDFTMVPQDICDICSTAFYDNKGSTSMWMVYNDETRHYWYYKLPDGQQPSTLENWEVRATFTVPGSGVVHTYTSNVLQTDYNCF